MTSVPPEPKAYAVNRYDFEAWRHWKILDQQLAQHRYMLGETYTLVDMAVWGWARAVLFVLGATAWEQLPNVKRLLDEINARQRNAPKRSRPSTPTRPRWTTKRGRPCSRKTPG